MSAALGPDPSSTFWGSRRAVVTGASGFLGSAVAAALDALGAEVVCVRRATCDLLDPAAIATVLEAGEPPVVLHLAGAAVAQVGRPSLVDLWDANVRTAWTVAEAAVRARAAALVLASSAQVYGPRAGAAGEADPIAPTAPYPTSKASAEAITSAHLLGAEVGLGIARLTNVYGPGDVTWSRLVPGTLRSLLEGEVPVLRSAGTAQRDYLFLDDAVRGVLLLAEASVAATSTPTVVNLGSGTGTSALELVAAAQDAAGLPHTPPVIEATAADQDQLVSVDRADARLGWRAGTTLSQGLSATLAWHRAQ